MSPFTRASGFPRRCLYVLTACASLWAQPASAVVASFSYPLDAAALAFGAAVGESIILPATDAPRFRISFVLPRDYINNTPVKIVLYLATEGAACQARLQAFSLLRSRVGSQSAFGLSGISGSGPVNLTGGLVANQKAFKLVAGNAPVGLLKGDAFSLEIGRDADNPGDTCPAAVLVRAIDIRYEKP